MNLASLLARSLIRSAVGRAIVAVPLLAGCSGNDATPDAEGPDSTGSPAEVPGESLSIRVRNDSSQVRYLHDPGYWLLSDSPEVRNFDIGDPDPALELALTTNQPECARISSGEIGCGSHGDRVAGVLALAPGATFSDEWNGGVWRRSELAGTPGCVCVEPVPAPSGTYRLRIGVASELSCHDTSCPCDPDGASCVTYGGTLTIERELEAEVFWPEQATISIEVE